MNSELFESINELATKKENEKIRKELIRKNRKKEREERKRDCITFIKCLAIFAIILAIVDLIWWLGSFWG